MTLCTNALGYTSEAFNWHYNFAGSISTVGVEGCHLLERMPQEPFSSGSMHGTRAWCTQLQETHQTLKHITHLHTLSRWYPWEMFRSQSLSTWCTPCSCLWGCSHPWCHGGPPLAIGSIWWPLELAYYGKSRKWWHHITSLLSWDTLLWIHT